MARFTRPLGGRNFARGDSAVTVCSLTRMTCESAFFQANEIISQTQALARGLAKAEASFTHSKRYREVPQSG